MKLLSFFLIMILCNEYLFAQDHLPQCKNQLSIEFLGNNFIDPNDGAYRGLISINYSRKLMLKEIPLIVTFGAGQVKAVHYDSASNSTSRIKIPEFQLGFLWRPAYKQNAFWLGLCFAALYGESWNSSTNPPYFIKHKYNFQLSPNLSYQFQILNEHAFCRLTIAPKILSSVFSENFGYRRYVLLWGGVSIGGGW